jgi:hypothetical protein
MTQDELNTLGGTQIAVGLSQVIRIQSSAFQHSNTLKIFSGGSLEIVAPQLSGTSTAAGNAWGKGYMLGSAEAVTWDGAAAFYLAATGSTVVAHMLVGYTQGATFL